MKIAEAGLYSPEKNIIALSGRILKQDGYIITPVSTNTKDCDMNFKRLLLAIVTVFAVLFASDWLIHGVLLKNAYQATAALWRPEAQMAQFCLWMFGGQLLLSAGFCVIYTFGHQARGMMEGVRFGALVALVLWSRDFVMYAVQPIPLYLIFYWMIGILVQLILAGIVVSLIYKK